MSLMFMLPLCTIVVPVVTVLSMSQTITSPNTATFNCTAIAKPRAIIQWIRNGMVLRDTTPRITITNCTQGDCNYTSPPSHCVLTSMLEIVNTVPDDGGEYICNASNPAGSNTEMVSLHINGMTIVYVTGCGVILFYFVTFTNTKNTQLEVLSL